jgi:hypothetical protein
MAPEIDVVSEAEALRRRSNAATDKRASAKRMPTPTAAQRRRRFASRAEPEPTAQLTSAPVRYQRRRAHRDAPSAAASSPSVQAIHPVHPTHDSAKWK